MKKQILLIKKVINKIKMAFLFRKRMDDGEIIKVIKNKISSMLREDTDLFEKIRCLKESEEVIECKAKIITLIYLLNFINELENGVNQNEKTENTN